MTQDIHKIGLIGSGNVASQLARAFESNDISISWIHSRNVTTGTELSNQYNADFITHLSPSLPGVDLILICVNDDSIQEVLDQLPSQLNVAYTSGTRPLQSLKYSSENLGVFYPLQTFTKGRSIDIFNVPFFIEALDTDFAQSLFDLAWKLSRNVNFASSDDRKKIHVAAVMVNNFVNHLFERSSEYMKANNLAFDHLLPLIHETIGKLSDLSPYEAQTGPARRNDRATMNEHLSLLEKDDKEIYKVITNSILRTYNHDQL